MRSDTRILTFAFPGLIEEEILHIGANQIPYMRTGAFSDMVLESEEILQQLIGCKNGKVVAYTASGTAAMESAVVNYASNFKKIMVINGGTFGKRWKEICDYHRLPCDEFKVDFGKDINFTKLEDHLKNGNYGVLLCQHHETSSGQLHDLNNISVLCRKYEISLVVDAISSFLSDPFNMMDSNVDMAVLTSQKGLNLPPGLAFLIISKKAMEHGFRRNNFYLDVAENLKNLKRGQTPYSPATNLFIQLNLRLKKIQKTGISHVLQKVNENAAYFRQACRLNNWPLSAQSASACITGFYINNGKAICKALLKENIFVMPSSKDDLIRISHIGIQNKAILDILIQKLKGLASNRTT